MADSIVLHQKAREAVRQGRLPARRPDRTWGGPGVGACCSICGERVGADQMELEIEFARGGGNPGLDAYHLHIGCFAAWDIERTTATAGRPAAD